MILCSATCSRWLCSHSSDPPVPLGFSLSPALSLPSCTSLVLDLYLHSSSLDSFNSKATHTLLQALLPQLPVLDLTLSLDGGLLGPPSICERMITPLAVVLNTSAQQPWPSLRSITHQGKIWCTPRSGPPFSTPLQLALARWTCEIVVFEISPPEWHELAGGPKEFDILLDPLPRESQADFLRETRRVEFRLKGQFADAFEHRFRDDLGRRTERGLSDHELRITSLIVFVDEKGKGRTLAVCEYDRVAPLTRRNRTRPHLETTGVKELKLNRNLVALSRTRYRWWIASVCALPSSLALKLTDSLSPNLSARHLD